MILPYCIVADSKVTAPATGVRRLAVEELSANSLRCFYSTLAQRPENFTQEDALQFYGTVQRVFEHAAVIPFRFPTVLENKQQLNEFLASKAPGYGVALQKLRDLVQMELRILQVNAQVGSSTTGKEYMTERLRSKRTLESAAGEARSALDDLFADWRQHETREGLRCYALVARDALDRFQQIAKALRPAEDIRLSVSGPWPATEFIE